jgi:hypothetical protein
MRAGKSVAVSSAEARRLSGRRKKMSMAVMQTSATKGEQRSYQLALPMACFEGSGHYAGRATERGLVFDREIGATKQ